MAKVFIEESTLTATADAIRAKKGTTALIDPAKFPNEISSIVAGGGELEIPSEELNLTGDQSYKFYRGVWSWFLNKYDKYMSTTNVSNTSYMFNDYSGIIEVPFEINLQENYLYASYMFSGCTRLKEIPKLNLNITGTVSYSNFVMSYMFQNCNSVRSLDNVFDSDALEQALSGFVAGTSSSSHPKVDNLFRNCRSLRTVPNWFYKLKTSNEGKSYPSSTYCLTYGAFEHCWALDEILDIPVLNYDAAQTSNMFYSSFSNCQRVKNVTFELNNGVPYVVNWKSQTIDLSISVGYGNNANGGYNTGISSDKSMNNADKYQANKNDPDSYTATVGYSRYNHASAVATINSLPDTSAYLASAGGTNTIKFKGPSGSLTDDGAVRDLTEEEIAVATAKGWTVTLVA